MSPSGLEMALIFETYFVTRSRDEAITHVIKDQYPPPEDPDDPEELLELEEEELLEVEVSSST